MSLKVRRRCAQRHICVSCRVHNRPIHRWDWCWCSFIISNGVRRNPRRCFNMVWLLQGSSAIPGLYPFTCACLQKCHGQHGCQPRNGMRDTHRHVKRCARRLTTDMYYKRLNCGHHNMMSGRRRPRTPPAEHGRNFQTSAEHGERRACSGRCRHIGQSVESTLSAPAPLIELSAHVIKQSMV